MGAALLLGRFFGFLWGCFGTVYSHPDLMQMCGHGARRRYREYAKTSRRF